MNCCLYWNPSYEQVCDVKQRVTSVNALSFSLTSPWQDPYIPFWLCLQNNFSSNGEQNDFLLKAWTGDVREGEREKYCKKDGHWQIRFHLQTAGTPFSVMKYFKYLKRPSGPLCILSHALFLPRFFQHHGHILLLWVSSLIPVLRVSMGGRGV